MFFYFLCIACIYAVVAVQCRESVHRGAPREDDTTIIEFGALAKLNWNISSWAESKEARICYDVQRDAPAPFSPPASLLVISDDVERFEFLLDFVPVSDGSPSLFCASVTPCALWNELHFLGHHFSMDAVVAVELQLIDSGVDTNSFTCELNGVHLTKNTLVNGTVIHLPPWGGVLTMPIQDCPLLRCKASRVVSWNLRKAAVQRKSPVKALRSELWGLDAVEYLVTEYNGLPHCLRFYNGELLKIDTDVLREQSSILGRLDEIRDASSGKKKKKRKYVPLKVAYKAVEQVSEAALSYGLKEGKVV